MTPLSVEESDDGTLLIGVDGSRCSVAVQLDEDADPEDIEETVREAWREARHSARIRGM